MMIENANPNQLGDEELFKPKKPLEDYTQVFDQATDFFSSYNPDMIEQRLLQSLKDEGIKDVKMGKNKYKYTFQKIGTDEQSNTDEAVLMTIRITKVNAEKVAVQFQRLQGTKIAFLKFYQQYKQIILNNFHDTHNGGT